MNGSHVSVQLATPLERVTFTQGIRAWKSPVMDRFKVKIGPMNVATMAPQCLLVAQLL